MAYFLNLSLQIEELPCLSWELGHLNILLPDGEVHQRFVTIVNGQAQAQPDTGPEQVLGHLDGWSRGG